MRWIYDRGASAAADRAQMARAGVTGAQLMRTAAEGLALAVHRRFPDEARQGVAIVCGPGNNGGDGYGAAHILKGFGYPVWVWPLSERSSGDAERERAEATRAGVEVRSSLAGAGVVIDAVFGTGLTREVTGRFADVVRAMARHPGVLVAADMPSGVCASTGQVLGVCCPADLTVSFGGWKQGMYAQPGAAHCGVCVVVPLGFDGSHRTAERVSPVDVANLWPRRDVWGHKQRQGHLLVVAGSARMAGASVLVCRGALAAGVGLVTLVAPRGAWPRLASLPPEVMVTPGGDGDHWDGTLPDLTAFDAAAVGPGLDREHGARIDASMASLHQTFAGPMVLDADAWTVTGPGAGPRVRTPHPGEASRHLQTSVGAVQSDRFRAVRRLVAAPNDVALLKGPHSLVCGAHGPVHVVDAGDAVLATAGSGDVLTGIVGALMARCAAAADLDLVGLAAAAAWVHGRAGERLAARRLEGWTASDVAAEVSQVAHELLVGTEPALLPRTTGACVAGDAP